ncbi:hypothetical protein G6Z20_04580 [Clostridium perfringens]|uniref:hypothetical protein n=1 Tax=Clostridium perfringens TaxID=1502 RepID=UPI0013E372E4|nr:hypothetical protein [Clostridium perfringens]NGT05412.1 hypothetical protein [Clostridium perfringens]WFE16411.1 hypothetical protein P7C83_07635 [Clostridium perfringens]
MKFLKKMYSLIIISLIFISLITGFICFSQTQKEYFLESKKFTEWIQFNTNGILLLIGAYSTIMAVVITINHANKLEENNRKHKLEKISALIYTDIKTYFNSINYSVINQIELFEKNDSDNIYYNFRKIQFLDDKFKDWIYEFIIIGDKKIGDLLLRFYYDYLISKREIEEESSVDNNYNILLSIIKSNYSDIIIEEFSKTNKKYKEANDMFELLEVINNPIRLPDDDRKEARQLRVNLDDSNFKKYNKVNYEILSYLEDKIFND